MRPDFGVPAPRTKCSRGAPKDVTFVCVTAGGLVTQAQTIGDKRAMLEAADDGDLLLAAWPGQWRQDIFVIDDRSAGLSGLETARQAGLSGNVRLP